MTDIFISYAREDSERVQPVVSALQEQGWAVFWDRRIPAGQTWRSYIGKALEEARCVIVAWSQDSVNSPWVIEEADEGKRRGVLVPVLLDEVEQPRGFREIQAANLTDWQPGQPSFQVKQFLEDVSVILRAPPGPPKIGVERKVETYISPEPKPPQDVSKSFSRFSIYGLIGTVVAVVIIIAVGIVLISQWNQGDKPYVPPHPAPDPAFENPSWPFTAERKVTVNDLRNLSRKELDLMRNEIYARHGWVFRRPDLADYFSRQPWYLPKGTLANREEANRRALAEMTNLEEGNVEIIRQYEQR